MPWVSHRWKFSWSHFVDDRTCCVYRDEFMPHVEYAEGETVVADPRSTVHG
jgi:hypothetical protein